MTESTPHINPNGVKIAKTVLMPGDPLRAQYIAEKFFRKMLNNSIQYVICLVTQELIKAKKFL